jgi:hypothetical protein
VQRGDQDVWRLWAFLALFAVVLGCSRLGGPPVAPTRTADSAPRPVVASPLPSHDSTSVALLSGENSPIALADHLASIIAAFIAILTLPRIYVEITRRPKLRIGSSSREGPDLLPVVEGTHYSLTAHFVPGQELSEWLEFLVFGLNTGSKSARDINWNLTFKPYVDVFYDRVTQPNRKLFREPHQVMLQVDQPYLHPKDVTVIAVRVRVPRGYDVTPLKVAIWLSDVAPVRQQLVLNIECRDCTSPGG